ncbi:MAG: hypothetical protein CM15mP74_00100 [Halieaceae bacterium]|nr:MAG: hypothetical protein CM15mP74_00100 [Halieaceae bacterium]
MGVNLFPNKVRFMAPGVKTGGPSETALLFAPPRRSQRPVAHHHGRGDEIEKGRKNRRLWGVAGDAVYGLKPPSCSKKGSISIFACSSGVRQTRESIGVLGRNGPVCNVANQVFRSQHGKSLGKILGGVIDPKFIGVLS